MASKSNETAQSPPNGAPAEESGGKLLKNLHILPPLQKEGTLTRDENLDAVQLPPIRPEEPVSSLRAALSEVCGYAHLTNYRFILMEKKIHSTAYKSSEIPSPYTGANAVVSLPSSFKSLAHDGNVSSTEIVLDDFGDLRPLVDKGLDDGSCFRIVLERYDSATVRDHVNRLRTLLNGGAPFVSNLADEVKKEEISDDPNRKESVEDSKEGAEQEKGKGPTPTPLPALPPGETIALAGTDLKDFFYLACGENRPVDQISNVENTTEDLFGNEKGDKPKKKGGKNKKSRGKDENAGGSDTTKNASSQPVGAENTLKRLNELEEVLHLGCTLQYSGFHPPPPRRRLMGDLCYLEFRVFNEPVIHLTGMTTGFYVNRTTTVDGVYKFVPSPKVDPYFSHELLDCLLHASESFCTMWKAALLASKERSDLTSSSGSGGALEALQRMAIRSDFGSRSDPVTGVHGLDSVVLRPTWLVPLPEPTSKEEGWNHNELHEYNVVRAEEDVCNAFGLDIRSGVQRDWNEELQVAREMPTSTQQERIDRARMVHKVMSDFGEAALIGAKAIFDGHIAPMNPNEPTRSHVYLHNNIFFSRAVDSGVETFKMAKGDHAAKKSASRDAQCMGLLHRLDMSGLFTLATVLVDYLGTRFVCQSIVPGILQGERTHSLLYGAVEATAPLSWDKETHDLFEENLGKSLLCATRTVPTLPLTDERIEEIEKIRSETSYLMDRPPTKEPQNNEPTTEICGPIEAKGIKGSDQRAYVLDLTRVTPRDANWIPKSSGGTGKWETVLEKHEQSQSNGKGKLYIPASLEDDEWTMAVLRPELIAGLVHKEMTKYFEKKKTAKDSASNETSNGAQGSSGEAGEDAETGKEGPSKPAPKKKKMAPEDEEYLKSLRYNVNVFLPHLRSLEDVNGDSVKIITKDEERVRAASDYLWETTLPKLTRDVRDGLGHQMPTEGRSLTELIHQRGINCRYMGRLAVLAAEQERRDRQNLADVQSGKVKDLERRTIPLCWLEMLEVEMIARAGKHVLDSYLNEGGGAGANQPLQTIASFLCALVSESEESAGETETRLRKEASASKNDDTIPDEDDFNSLTIVDTGGSGDSLPSPIRGRKEVWEDIEREVGRRFRYVLSFYNKGNPTGRALYVPLLRRMCQRFGVRLVAKNYNVGAKCLCSGGSTDGGRMSASYPISPLDIVDVNPLVKHAASLSGEGFVPCIVGSPVSLPSLYVLLPDAKATFEAAHLSYGGRALPHALDLAQEAASLYQRVLDSPMHVNVARCIDLTAAILFEANEAQLAIANATKGLALAVQLGGFDCAEVMTGHSTLSHIMLSSGRLGPGLKHLKAAIYLMELLSGHHHAELGNAYHKMGTIYHETGDAVSALRCYQEATTRPHADRLAEGMMAKSMAVLLANTGQFKAAVETEKRAYQLYSILLGEEHDLTKNSQKTLESITILAVQQGNRKVAAEQKRREELAAEAMASQIEADEAEEEEKRKKKNNKKKKKK